MPSLRNPGRWEGEHLFYVPLTEEWGQGNVVPGLVELIIISGFSETVSSLNAHTAPAFHSAHVPRMAEVERAPVQAVLEASVIH